MEIEEFIRETLRSIADGLFNANVEICKSRGSDAVRIFQLSSVASKMPSHVTFDLAVTSRSSKEGGGEGKARIAVVELAAGGHASSVREEVSRIRFDVAVLRDVG